jgi:hypothetical protein
MSTEKLDPHTIDPKDRYHVDRFITGILRELIDNENHTPSPPSLDRWREAIRDSSTEIGKRAREIHETLGKILNS